MAPKADKLEVFELLRRLSSPTAAERLDALYELVMLDDIRIERLAARASLFDSNAEIRDLAASTLAACAERRDLRAMLLLSHDPSDSVRASVVEAISKYPTKRTMKRLVEMLDDVSESVRSSSAFEISWGMIDAGPAGIKADEARELLRNRLVVEKEDYVRVTLLAGLILCGDATSADALLEHTNHPVERVREHAQDLAGVLDLLGEASELFERALLDLADEQ